MKQLIVHVLALELALFSVPTLAEEFKLSSPAFAAGESIPKIHACYPKGGENQSIPLNWSGAPAGTARYAVLMDDETSPCRSGDGACRHWMVYNLPASVNSLQAGQAMNQIQGVTEGRSYSGRVGYDGMCPPGPHRYTITVYALKETAPLIPAETALTRSQFAREYAAHILGTATIAGEFSPW